MPAGLESVFGYRTSQGANKALAKAAERAGIEYLSCHEIGRHTFAARILGAGYDLKTLKEAGRWKKLAVVDECYGHLEQGQYHDAMLAVAEVGHRKKCAGSRAEGEAGISASVKK
jgi:integrase